MLILVTLLHFSRIMKLTNITPESSHPLYYARTGGTTDPRHPSVVSVGPRKVPHSLGERP